MINTPLKLLANLDRLSAIKDGQKLGPVNVEIDLSNRCSLGCEWCHFAYTHTRGPLAQRRSVDAGDLMSYDLARKIMHDLARNGVRSITWSGGGEPTLNPDFDDIVNACPLPQGLYTNGVHLDANRATLLKERCAWVYVSLDAATSDEYKELKGVERFYEACNGVRELVSASGEATIGIGFLLNEANWQSARLMYSLAQKLGADYCQFRPTILYNADLPSERTGNVAWINKAQRTLEWLSTQPGVMLDHDRFKMLHRWREHGYATCWWSGLQCVITPNGDVYACLNKRGLEAAKLGNMADELFAHIWQRSPLQCVNDQCRVMCRGHIPNVVTEPFMQDVEHKEFI